jgi:adenylate cyclase
MDSFARYLPREVVRLLLREGKQAELGGCTENIAVMFTDIQDFTTYTESINAKRLFGYLNEYFTALSQCVTEHNGTIDKYIGDSIMAMWGMPAKLENPCEEACESALAIRTASNRLRDLWTFRSEPLIFNTRIGLHFGEAIIGNVGASERFNYTIIGDTVNLASRLEGTNKAYGTTIIVSEDVINQLKKEKADYKFSFRMLGRVNVKGKLHQTIIYELQGHRSSLRQSQIHDLEIWNEVMRVSIESGPAAALIRLSAEASTLGTSSLLMQLKTQLTEANAQAEP